MEMVLYNCFTIYYKNITSWVGGVSVIVLQAEKNGFLAEAVSPLTQRQTISEMSQRTRAVKRAAARKAMTFW